MEVMVVVVDELLHVDEVETHDEAETRVEIAHHEMVQQMDFVLNDN